MVVFKSRQDHKKTIELEKARKAGLAPAEIDEDGKEINPHTPQFLNLVPWYSSRSKNPSLKHQKKWKNNSAPLDDHTEKNSWYDRGAKTHQAEKFRKGSCQNCGSMSHGVKSCTERPRKVGARFTSKKIAADEKIESFELDYDGKRDRWNGCDPLEHHRRVVERHEAQEEARKKYLKKQKIKKLEEKLNKKLEERNYKKLEEKLNKKLEKKLNNSRTSDEDEEDEEDDSRVDEAKVDESRQMDFAKVEKRVRTTGGGSTGTVRNLRIREDTAKYLLNLDLNSAHYDPKSRSMREDPLPDVDPNDKFYLGDNHCRNSGQALEFKQMNIHSWEAFEKGHDMHTEAAPSQADFLYKNFKIAKEKLKSQTKDSIMRKYGNAAAATKGDEIPMELLLGQSERQVEYDRAGRIIKGQEVVILPPKSKYEEDVLTNNHTSVWGSWWKDHQCGYICCKQTFRNSYCTGSAGIEAAEAVLDLMKANIEDKEASKESTKNVGEKKRMATWGTDVGEDLELNEEKLANALKKEDERKREEKDERKRKYNVKYNNEVTQEEIEAYRVKRVRHEDPMKGFL
ncbi:unnamed protein product [Thlaspi arvense]|uniref:Pre-mRNA-splicing factor SLU7 n=1 Tax=Thlaspi arvense TaxID=13288 RepID=A0AAU9T4Q6_THLAR|nr:unnamed protein product [Thlaspi arvense]